MNLAEWADRHAERFGDYESVAFLGRTWRSGPLHDDACRLASALIALGVAPGDRVVVLLPTCPDVLVVSAAIWRCGAVFVPCYVGLTEPEIARILEHCTPRAVVVAPEVLPRVRTLLSGIETVITTGADDGPISSHSALIAAHERLARPLPRASSDIAQITYTSGTTGIPKGVVYTHGSVGAWLGWLDSRRTANRDPSRLVFQAPSTFGGTFMTTRFVENGLLVLLEAFEPEAVFSAIERYRVTALTLVPSMGEALLAHSDQAQRDCSSITTLMLAGAPLTPSLAARLEARFGVPAANVYGSAEAGGTVTKNENGTKRGSVGRPYPGVDVRILGEDGATIAKEESGEILVRTPWIAAGYYASPGQTAATFVDGWLRTGDRGFIGTDGDLYLSGRSKEMIIQGGVNVFPDEVAEVIERIAEVKECAVVGLPNALLGEAVVACVALNAGAHLTPEAIWLHCRTEMDPRKVPSRVHLLPGLPRGQQGKVRLAELRAQLAKLEADVTVTPFVLNLRAEESEDARVKMLEEFLVDGIAQVLRITTTDVIRAATLNQLGVDSLGTQLLLNRARSALGIAVPDSSFEGSVVDAAERIASLVSDPSVLPELAPPIERSDDDVVTLSFWQESALEWERAREPSTTWVFALRIRVEGDLDLSTLDRATASLVERQEALRLALHRDPAIAPRRCSLAEIAVTRVAMVGASDQEVDAVGAARVGAPFAFDGTPLVRFLLVQRREREHCLYVGWHQIIHDPTSFPVLVSDLFATYEGLADGREPSLPPLAFRYTDHARWERSWFESGGGRAAVEAARAIARDAIALRVPVDRPRHGPPSTEAITARFVLEGEAAERFIQLCRSSGVTFFMGSVGVLALSLSRWCETDDVTLMTVMSTRRREDLRPLIGKFSNWGPLRVSLAHDPTVAELFARVRNAASSAYSRATVPGSLVYGVRDVFSHPLGRVVINAPDFDAAKASAFQRYGAITVTPEVAPKPDTCRTELTLALNLRQGRIAGRITAAQSLFDPSTIARCGRDLEALFRALTLDARISTLG